MHASHLRWQDTGCMLAINKLLCANWIEETHSQTKEMNDTAWYVAHGASQSVKYGASQCVKYGAAQCVICDTLHTLRHSVLHMVCYIWCIIRGYVPPTSCI